MRFLLLLLSLVLQLNTSGFANHNPQENHVIETQTSQKHRLSVTINRNGENKIDCPFRFQGQYEDSETGLYYNLYRYYSPDEGIYLSQDPIRLAGNNPTLYVHDPNSWVDVFGLDTIRLRHYTDNKGFNSIQSEMKIRAYDQNAIFAESARKNLLSSADAATTCHIKGNKDKVHRANARNYIEFEVDTSRVSKIKNSLTGVTEYKITGGDVNLDSKITKFEKRCH